MMRNLVLKKWAEVRAGLIATIEKFAGHELAYRPFPDAYSVVETILHIAHEEEIEAGYGLTRRLSQLPPAYDPLHYPSKGLLLDLLAESHSHTLTYVQTLSDEDFEAPVELAWGQTSPRSDVLLHVLEHEIHHRAELSLMLGLLGRQGLDA